MGTALDGPLSWMLVDAPDPTIVMSYDRRVLAHNEAQLAHRLSILPNIFELYRNRFANQQGTTTTRLSGTNSNEWRKEEVEGKGRRSPRWPFP